MSRWSELMHLIEAHWLALAAAIGKIGSMVAGLEE